ncbi:hypothetical protein FCV25MIE_21250 [Fagus crenata]
MAACISCSQPLPFDACCLSLTGRLVHVVHYTAQPTGLHMPGYTYLIGFVASDVEVFLRNRFGKGRESRVTFDEKAQLAVIDNIIRVRGEAAKSLTLGDMADILSDVVEGFVFMEFASNESILGTVEEEAHEEVEGSPKDEAEVQVVLLLMIWCCFVV